MIYAFPVVSDMTTKQAFLQLVEEALELQSSQKLFPTFPLRAIAFGISALLHHRTHNHQMAVDHARQCLELALNDKLTRFCFPCIFLVSHLVPMAKAIWRDPDYAPLLRTSMEPLFSSGACL